MRIAVTYGPMCLQRTPEQTWSDPRTGSEIGWRRIVEGLQRLGHKVTRAAHGDERATISINEPDSLRGTSGLRICCFWLNEFSFCKPGFDEHVDVYLSPSDAHREMAIGAWGAPKPEKWWTNYLGCDPELYGNVQKVSGRVVYCSSPDRGLHRVLEAWPRIKRAVPHATLHVFYRLEPWIRGFDETPYFPPIEKLRHRALWVERALRRMSGLGWGITVHDSVDRATMAREMSRAEVLAHPCETTSWSEGFSCTVLEGCAAQACPIVSDCDALGEVYAPIDPFPVGDWQGFADRMVRALTDAAWRGEMNAKARSLAERLTWKAHVERLNEVILGHIKD